MNLRMSSTELVEAFEAMDIWTSADIRNICQRQGLHIATLATVTLANVSQFLSFMVPPHPPALVLVAMADHVRSVGAASPVFCGSSRGRPFTSTNSSVSSSNSIDISTISSGMRSSTSTSPNSNIFQDPVQEPARRRRKVAVSSTEGTGVVQGKKRKRTVPRKQRSKEEQKAPLKLVLSLQLWKGKFDIHSLLCVTPVVVGALTGHEFPNLKAGLESFSRHTPTEWGRKNGSTKLNMAFVCPAAGGKSGMPGRKVDADR
jgi:hypothetical protein